MSRFVNSYITLIRSNYKRIENQKKQEFYIVEPGYIMNKSSFLVYSLIGGGTTYGTLRDNVCRAVSGMTMSKADEVLEGILEAFFKRNIISIDGQMYETDKYVYTQTLIEKDYQKRTKSRPITQIDIVPTSTCNFRCRHCYLNEKSFADSFYLDVDKWKTVLDDLANRGLMSIVVTGGEPLMYPYILELLDYADSKKIKIQLLTNGALINDQIIEHVKKYYRFSIQISLDGSSAESSELQRGDKGSFNRVVKNIKKMTDCGINVVIAMVLNRRNIADIYDNSMINLCNKLNVKALGITPTVIMVSEAKKNKEMFLTAKEAYDAIRFVEENKKNYPEGLRIKMSAPPALVQDESISFIRKVRPRCRRGTNSFSVRPDGKVYICSDFAEVENGEYYLGNILEDSIDSIIDKMIKVDNARTDNYENIKGVCSICKELPYCWGACRADAYSQFKDMNAPYPFCQALYECNEFPQIKIDNEKEYKPIWKK